MGEPGPRGLLKASENKPLLLPQHSLAVMQEASLLYNLHPIPNPPSLAFFSQIKGLTPKRCTSGLPGKDFTAKVSFSLILPLPSCNCWTD